MNQVSQNQLAALQLYFKPVPVPSGFTSREIVRRAIEFDGPPRIPYSFIDPLESDFAEMGALAAIFWPTGCVPKGEMRFDEWDVGWRGSGRLWGHPDVNPLTDLSALDTYLRGPRTLSESD